MGRLHTYKFNDDIVKKVTTLPGATNHGLVMMVDWSGSMADNIKGTISQIFNLVWFCRKVNIPFSVVAFSDVYARGGAYGYGREEPTMTKAGDIAMKKFNLLEFFSSDMTASEENDMIHNLVMYVARFAPISGSYRFNATTIIKDPVSGKNVEGSDTPAFLELLKARVPGMNVIGFFIAGTGKSGRVDKRSLYYLLPGDGMDAIMEKVKFLNKNKYLAITSLGYDEYYVLPGGNSLEIVDEGLGDEMIGASKAKLKSAFGKSMKGKVASRPLLNKFIKLVA